MGSLLCKWIFPPILGTGVQPRVLEVTSQTQFRNLKHRCVAEVGEGKDGYLLCHCRASNSTQTGFSLSLVSLSFPLLWCLPDSV
jgi:hypothetical protein